MPILGLIIGGALGTLCRYLTTVATQSLLPSSAFPLATLIVNVLGCFLIGMLSPLGPAGHVSPTAHLALGTGFAGAFTTFSTFELEADTLARGGAWNLAATYVIGSLALGYLSLQLGRWTATRLTGGLT